MHECFKGLDALSMSVVRGNFCGLIASDKFGP